MRAVTEQQRDREFGPVDGMQRTLPRCLTPDP